MQIALAYITYIILAVSLVCAVLLVLVLIKVGRGGAAAERALREELRAGREEAGAVARELREELKGSLAQSSDGLFKIMNETLNLQRTQLEGVASQLRALTDSNRASLDSLRAGMESRLEKIREGSEKKLDDMRAMVDEKLQVTLEKRLGESFKLVSERLEAVHQGLGEMQNLAAGVGDLKRVLSDVRARGTLGEIQCGAILEQILTPDQYGQQVICNPETSERVDFAVRLPGPSDDPDACIWLPIDSKFPQEDYLRLLDAQEKADAEEIESAGKSMSKSVRSSAKSIRDKYLNPPWTTDFGVMFLPTEGLYAEVVRQPGLMEELQRTCRVVVAGPATFSALLNSLRMGFKTLAIEKRASEVWTILGAVKTEFAKFGDILEKVKKQLEAASRSLDDTGVRTRAIQRKLREVESLPERDTAVLLPPPDDEEI